MTPLRPHDVSLLPEPVSGGTEALVRRIVPEGSGLDVELELADGTQARARISAEQADGLELAEGDIVRVRALGDESTAARRAAA